MMKRTEWRSLSDYPLISGFYEISHGENCVKRVLPSPFYAWFDAVKKIWQLGPHDPTMFATVESGPFDLRWRGLQPYS